MRRNVISQKELETLLKKKEEQKRAEELKVRQQAAWDKLIKCNDSNGCGCKGGCGQAYMMSLTKEGRRAIKIASNPRIIGHEEWDQRGQQFHIRNKGSNADRRGEISIDKEIRVEECVMSVCYLYFGCCCVKNSRVEMSKSVR